MVLARSNAHAEAVRSGDDLETVIVTGTRTAQRLADTPKPATFIDRQQIDELNPSTIFDILRTVPGLSVSRSGGLEGQISLRGFNSNNYHSPLFIDGDRFKGRNTLEYLLLEPEDMARVEVIRGPAAEAYGSEAVGGVVLLTTYHAEPESGDFNITGGGASMGYSTVNNGGQAHYDLEMAGDNLGVRLSASGRQAGDYQTPEGKAHNSDYQTGNISADVAYAIDANQKLDFTAREISLHAGRAGGIGGSPGYPLTQQRDVLQAQTARLAYSGDYVGWLRHLDADIFFDHFFGKIPNSNFTKPMQISTSTSYVVGPTVVGGNILGLIPWESGNSTVGLDWIDEMRPDGSQSVSQTVKLNASGQPISVTTGPRTKKTPGDNQVNIGLFADNVWNPSSRWTLTAGGRADLFQTTTGTSPVAAPALEPLYAANQSRTVVAETGSLGLIYHWTSALDIVGNAGNVFRMPSDTELFSASVSGTGYSLPNPALKPERGLFVESGLRLHSGTITGSVTTYYDRYRDFVETVNVMYEGTLSTQSQNVQQVELAGVEGDINVKVAQDTAVYGNFTYTRATDLMTSKPLPYIAPLHGTLGLRYAPDQNYALHAEIVWSEAKTRIDPTQEFGTGAYGEVNIGAEVALAPWVGEYMKNTRLIVSIDNLFNVPYRDGATYANISYPESMTNPLLEPGRNFTFTLRYRF
jgi:hemoglobin/transferrin/lactoferrin receptor protein